MAVIYRDPEFLVENRFFGGWRVTDLYLRKTIKPARELSTALGLTWPHVRLHRSDDALERRAAEDLLMKAFALAVTEANSLERTLFLNMAPQDLAAMIIREAGR